MMINGPGGGSTPPSPTTGPSSTAQTHIISSDAGIGLFTPGQPNDYLALTAMFAAHQGVWTQQGLDTGKRSVRVEMSAGEAFPTVPAFGSVFPVICPNSGQGATNIEGQGAGASQITFADRIVASGTLGVTSSPTVFTDGKPTTPFVFTTAHIGMAIYTSGGTGGVYNGSDVIVGVALGSAIMRKRVQVGANLTWSLSKGCIGDVQVITSAQRGGSGGGPNNALNRGGTINGIAHAYDECTYTLGFAAPHNREEGSIIVVPQVSRGRTVLNHYSVLATSVSGDNTKLQFCMGTEVGNSPDFGPSIQQADQLDAALPIVGAACYFPEWALEPLNWSSVADVTFDKMMLNFASNTNTPLDGMVVRMTARVMLGPDFGTKGNPWIGPVYCGNAHGTVALRAGGFISGTDWATQNTDHNFITSRMLTGGHYNIGFIDNSKSSWPAFVGHGLGGGRDNHINEYFGSSVTEAHVLLNDGGQFETTELSGTNTKDGHHVIKAEGIDGVIPIEPCGIDGVQALFIKLESPGNTSFYHDESFRRSMFKSLNFGLRMEAGISTNGAEAGTPGGHGTTAVGSFGDKTSKPWAGTAAKLVADGTGMPVAEVVVPRAMFGIDAGGITNSIVVLGNGVRSGTDGQTIASSGTFYSPTMVFTNDDLPANGKTTGLRIFHPGLLNGSDTIASLTDSHHVVMTHAVVDHAATNFTVENDGTSAQSGICFAGRVRDWVDSGDHVNIKIHMEYPNYGDKTSSGTTPGPDLVGPYAVDVGMQCFIRAGYLGAWNMQTLFETEALDAMLQAQAFIDVGTLGDGQITMMRDDTLPAIRRRLPAVRVRDFICMKGADGHITGPSATPQMSFDVQNVSSRLNGCSITGTNIPASTTITYVSPGVVKLSKPTAFTGAVTDWVIGAVKNVVPPAFGLKIGTKEYFLAFHDPGDPNPLFPNCCVEYTKSADNNHCVRRSQADVNHIFGGLSRFGNPAGAFNATRTILGANGVGDGAGRVLSDGPATWIAKPGHHLMTANDLMGFVSPSATPIAGDALMFDGGDGYAYDVVNNPGINRLLIGKSIIGVIAGKTATGVLMDRVSQVQHQTELRLLGTGTNLTTPNEGVGGMPYVIPSSANGKNLVDAQAYVLTAPTGAAVNIGIRKNAATEMLTTDIIIAAGQLSSLATGGSGGVPKTNGSQTVATGDLIWVDIDQIGSTIAGAGLIVMMTFI